MVILSIKLANAFDRAAMSVCYGQEAADHYGVKYTFIRSVRNWCGGFVEGFARANVS